MRILTIGRSLLALGIALSASASHAGVISVSQAAPTVDGADIFNDNGTTDAGGDGDPGHIWSDRPHQGQTFVTGSNAGGYELSSVTLKNLSTTRTSNPTFNLLIGSITGTTFTQVGTTETAVAPDFAPGDYITFKLDTPVLLDANTTYGFLWGTGDSGFIPTNNMDDSTFPGGTAISSGDNNSPDLDNLIPRNLDRVFFLDIAEVPEPGTLVLLGLGMFSLMGRGRNDR